MFEKRFAAVPAQVFTADGGANGSVSIADVRLFKVKQQVVITATGQTNLELEVKRIVNSTSMIVGPIAGNINAFTNLSAYTTAAGASIFANEQRRPTITSDDFERAVYEEEPVVAKRVILVDELGNKYDDNNPLPTSASFTGAISVGEVDQGLPNTIGNAWPVKITDGTDALDINPDGSINVNVNQSIAADGLIIDYNEVSSVGSGSETTIITITAPVGGQRIQKVDFSGDNKALYKVKVDGNTIAARRTWWTHFNESVNFEGFVNGLLLTAGQVLTVTVIHNRPDLGAFEATVMSV
jgi:hypothetical protein